MRFASLKTRIAVDVECIHSCMHPSMHSCMHASMRALFITSRARCNGNRVDATDRVGNRIESPPPPPAAVVVYVVRATPALSSQSQTERVRRPARDDDDAPRVSLPTTVRAHGVSPERRKRVFGRRRRRRRRHDDDDDMRRDARERCRSSTGRTPRTDDDDVMNDASRWMESCIHAFIHSSPVRDDDE